MQYETKKHILLVCLFACLLSCFFRVPMSMRVNTRLTKSSYHMIEWQYRMKTPCWEHDDSLRSHAFHLDTTSRINLIPSQFQIFLPIVSLHKSVFWNQANDSCEIFSYQGSRTRSWRLDRKKTLPESKVSDPGRSRWCSEPSCGYDWKLHCNSAFSRFFQDRYAVCVRSKKILWKWYVSCMFEQKNDGYIQKN